MAGSSLVLATTGGPGCEVALGGPLDEPVAALSSLAFVVAGLVVVLRARRPVGVGPPSPAALRRVVGYAVLVASVGVGSFVQHGPDPAWSDVAHDLPLLATLAFVGADAAADLSGRRRTAWWWALPVTALVPLVVLTPRAGDLAQVAVAVVAVGLAVRRAVAHPALRRPTGTALGLLAVGGTLGTLSRAGWPLCDPASPWQGHAAWHVLAAAALGVLAATIGRGGGDGSPGPVRGRRVEPWRTGSHAAPAPTSTSTPTTRSTGSSGARRRSRRPGAGTSRS